MTMEVHATSWAPLDHGSMTTTTGVAGMTESQTDERRCSNSSNPREQDWAAIVSSCLQQESDPASSNNMDLGLFYIDNLDAQFGVVDDFADHEPSSATITASSPLSSSVCDPNGATHPFQVWHHPVTHAPPMMGCEQYAPYQPEYWLPPQLHGQPMSFGMHVQSESLGIQMPPTSHPVDIPGAMPFNRPLPEHEENRHGLIHAWERPEHSVPPQDDIFAEDEEREGADPADPCYAQLLYQCLREAPNHTLSLRELYEWISQHSQKAKDPKNRGWQNSVRHNLSMNAAFTRAPHHATGGPKKGSLWRLTEEALRDGVISTTRYRKDPKRKPERRGAPALSRQTSGAKGGRATRDATRYRQQQQQQAQQNRQQIHGLPTHPRFRRNDRPRVQYSLYSMRSAETSPQPGFLVPPSTPSIGSPYFIDDPAGLPLPQTPPHASTPPSHLQFTNMPYDNPHEAKFMSHATAPGNFEFLPLDYNQHGGLFGNHDPELHQRSSTPNTPSLMTEASFMTDDNLPPSTALMACEGEHLGFPS